MIADFIKDGKVKLEFHHFPLQMHGAPATTAANAAECAADQNSFWPYHDQLFAQISAQGASAVTIENMSALADSFHLDDATFTTCVTQQTHSQEVQDSVNQAIAQGFPGTPTILVNGQMLDSLDYDTLRNAVNAALAQASN